MLDMIRAHKICLSKEGQAFLNDPEMNQRLTSIANSIGVTPEEYLYRFEKMMKTAPEKIFAIFEK